MMSVLVETPEGRLPAYYQRGARRNFSGAAHDLSWRKRSFQWILFSFRTADEYERLSADGFRVLAVAYKDMEQRPVCAKEDEQNLVLRGYVAFLDPPKESAQPAITALQKHGVRVKILTGDNDLVTKKSMP